MTGTWTDQAAGEPDLIWSIVNTGSAISGTMTSVDPCGNQITWQTVAGSYNSSNQKYSLTATGGGSTSCGGVWSPNDQIVNGTIQSGSCGIGSGTFQAGTGIVSNPPGTILVSGSNSLSVADRVPTGENSNNNTSWLDQYGAVTTAQFNVTLSSTSGYNFGGRTITETAGTTQGDDSCTYQGAPWNKMLQLKPGAPWNVQNNGQNGSYGPDLVGLSADQVAYIQAFAGLGSGGCTVSYPEIMKINNDANTGPEAYGGTNSGNNTIIFAVTPTQITVTRGNASISRPFHF